MVGSSDVVHWLPPESELFSLYLVPCVRQTMGIQRCLNLPSTSSRGWKFRTRSRRSNLTFWRTVGVCMFSSNQTAPSSGDGTTTSLVKRRLWHSAAGRKSRKGRLEQLTLPAASCCAEESIRCSNAGKPGFARGLRQKRPSSRSQSRGSMRRRRTGRLAIWTRSSDGSRRTCTHG